MEAACIAAARPDLRVSCAGLGPLKARAAAELLVDAGVSMLASVGLAGGVDPQQRTGAIVLADQVLGPRGEVLACDPAAVDAIAGRARDAGLTVAQGHLAGTDRPVTTASAKLSLYAATGAVAVDMESHAVAKAAAEAGVPFVALRVIADAAIRNLPRAALAGVTPDGHTRPWAVVATLLYRPWELVGVISLGRESRIAMAALSQAAGLLHP